MKGGPSISFCGSVLSSMTKSYDSNLHEFANLVGQWTRELGPPDDAKAAQQFVEGSPFSNLSYNWNGTDNVRRSLGFYQLGSRSPQVVVRIRATSIMLVGVSLRQAMPNLGSAPEVAQGGETRAASSPIFCTDSVAGDRLTSTTPARRV